MNNTWQKEVISQFYGGHETMVVWTKVHRKPNRRYTQITTQVYRLELKVKKTFRNAFVPLLFQNKYYFRSAVTYIVGRENSISVRENVVSLGERDGLFRVLEESPGQDTGSGVDTEGPG